MISQEQIDIIINTLKPFNPEKIGVFGSYSRGDNGKATDIYILYQFKDTIGLFSLIKLKGELEKKLNKRVDLLSEKYIHPRLKSNIMRDLKLIYEQN